MSRGKNLPRTASTSKASSNPEAAARMADEQGGPRSRKGAQTRARLLDAAKQVFERDGFLDARISDVAEAAGISHGAFYHYFDSKEQIFREVAEAQESFLTAPPVDEGPADGAFRSPWERIGTANRRYLERYRDTARIMGVIEQVSRFDQHVEAGRAGRQKHFAERAERAIRRWQADGLVEPTVDPAIAATALGAMVARFAELWLVQGYAAYDFDHAVEQLTRLWAKALGLNDAREMAPTRTRRSKPT
jgi:AcrR family transcriptional regulator